MTVYTNINRNNKSPKKQLSSKTVGIILLAMAAVCYLALITSFIGFLKYFLLGLFGLFAYPIFLAMFVVGNALYKEKKYSFSFRYVVYLAMALLSFVGILHIFFSTASLNTFGSFIADTYNAQVSIGGIFFGIITFPFLKLLGTVGAVVFYLIVLIVSAFLIYDYLIAYNSGSLKQKKQRKELKSFVKSFSNINETERTNEVVVDNRGVFNNNLNQNITSRQQETTPTKQEIRERRLYQVDSEKYFKSLFANVSGKPILEGQKETINTDAYDPYAGVKRKSKEQLEKEARNRAFLRATYNNKDSVQVSNDDSVEEGVSTTFTTKSLNNRINNRLNGINVEPIVNSEADFDDDIFNFDGLDTNIESVLEENKTEETFDFDREPITPSNDRIDSDFLPEIDINEEPKNVVNNRFTNRFGNKDIHSINTIENKNSIGIEHEDIEVVPEIDNSLNNRLNNRLNGQNNGINSINNTNNSAPSFVTPKPVEQAPIITKQAVSNAPYIKPPMNLLSTISTRIENYGDEYNQKSQILERTLNEFKVPAKVVNVVRGPAVTRYEIKMPTGISVKKVLQHSEDIAMALASNGDIRIEAPIPGKSLVGIEVPNRDIATVALREVLQSKPFYKAKSPLTFGLGKDIAGQMQVCDLARMPHLLVAGATGSGKSVCLNSLIISMLYKASPEDLRLILIDPKRVEFYVYNELPHLMLPNVITETDKAIKALDWSIEEMEKRFKLFQGARVKNLAEYNAREEILNKTEAKLPILVIIIDELADLMINNKREVEDKIMKLAAKARAAGIHLVLATQRPSVDVITGTIKANLPSRIAFSVTSGPDSKTILDGGGAEKLLGKGDMLYNPIDFSNPKRVQGAFVTNNEVKDIVDFVKKNNQSVYDDSIRKAIMEEPKRNSNLPHVDGGFDSIMPEALKLVIATGGASISMIQRRFSVGYARAARIIDQMELAKFISPSDGSKARSVYITLEKYKELFGEE